jgi:hypothetical protein
VKSLKDKILECFCDGIQIIKTALIGKWIVKEILSRVKAGMHNIRPAGQMCPAELFDLALKTPLECVQTYKLWPLDMSKKNFLAHHEMWVVHPCFKPIQSKLKQEIQICVKLKKVKRDSVLLNFSKDNKSWLLKIN